jgi:mannose-6-phosphate isomerase-like protein (cupin superfamily)
VADHALVKIDDIEGAHGGIFKRARATLGVTSFGMQVLDFEPGFEGHPEHDHADDGREEVYVFLRGGGDIQLDGERQPFEEGHMARMGPTTRRKLYAGPEGLRVLAIGGYPGKAYEPEPITELEGS